MVTWQRPAVYRQVRESYVTYFKSKYDQAVIVFDGYDSGPSTKEMTQMRKRGSANSPKVEFEETNEVSLKRDIVFSKQRKQESICSSSWNAPHKSWL